MKDQPGDSGTVLRLARQARGFSQQQLAGMAGVSRQAVSAVESGVSDPSLRVALALARALGLSAEELFGRGHPAPLIAARPVASISPSSERLVLAPVGDSLVALPLTGAAATQSGFQPAGARLARSSAAAAGAADPGGKAQDGADPYGVDPGGDPEADGDPGVNGPGGFDPPATILVRPIGPPRPTLVVAGCDPALPLLEAPLALLDPPVAFVWWPCASREALRLAAAGLVHVAGAHLRDDDGGNGVADGVGEGGVLGAGAPRRDDDGGYNPGPARGRRRGAEIVGFCSWREGLVLRPELVSRVRNVTDLAASGLRLVNREPGSEARRVLDRELAAASLDPARLAGYQTRATGHLEVAAAIAAGLADAGVASEPAALAYELAFVPLTDERFDLIVPARQTEAREVQAMRRVLSSPWLLDQLASLPGYDPARCGEHLADVPGPAGPPDRSRPRS